jgi:hypothetical protein
MGKALETSAIKRLAPPTCAVAVLVLLSTATLLSRDDEELVAVIVVGIWAAVTALVGALVSSRRPENAVGWLLLVGSLILSAYAFFEAYAVYALESHPGSLPFGHAAAWVTLWLAIPGFFAFVFVFLLFPTGRLLSSRWKIVVYAGLGSLVLMSVTFAIKPGPVNTVPGVDNPLGVAGSRHMAAFIEGPGTIVVLAPALLALGSLVVRMRRAGQQERQQMKWFVYAVSLFPLLFLIAQIVSSIFRTEEDWPGFFLVMVGLLLIPVSIGMSILRYRLYDIDRIINKTLVYGTVTAVLLAGYTGVVLLLQASLPLPEDSSAAIAASTLAMAALFGPLRKRTQDFVDRRFYRARYDAVHTVDKFGARLRHETNLDSVNSELLDVVKRTVHPTHTSLWLLTERTGVIE